MASPFAREMQCLRLRPDHRQGPRPAVLPVGGPRLELVAIESHILTVNRRSWAICAETLKSQAKRTGNRLGHATRVRS